jgi:hypothetical protein
MSNILSSPNICIFWVRNQELVPPNTTSQLLGVVPTLYIIRVTGTFRSIATSHIPRRFPSVQGVVSKFLLSLREGDNYLSEWIVLRLHG